MNDQEQMAREREKKELLASAPKVIVCLKKLLSCIKLYRRYIISLR